MPFLVNAIHCHHWSVVAWPASVLVLVRARGSVVVPVKVAAPSLETLIRMSLLQAPAVFTPVKRFWPVAGSNPAGTQPLDSFECWLM